MNRLRYRIRLFSLAAAVLLALPLPLGWARGGYLYLSPFLTLGGALALRTWTVFSVAGMVVLFLFAFGNRWLCRYLCPVGALCDTISRAGHSANLPGRIPRLSRYILLAAFGLALAGVPLLLVIDPMSLFYAFFDIFHTGWSLAAVSKMAGLILLLLSGFFLPFTWCQKICPLGELQVLIWQLRQRIIPSARISRPAFHPARRSLLAFAAAVPIGLLISRFQKGRTTACIRPPGSVPEETFITTCSRCGNCVKACPSGIILPAVQGSALSVLFTPEISFSRSYCLPECTRCGTVCPTGAIQPFTKEQKATLFLGRAIVNSDRCVLTKGQECNCCLSACVYKAVKFVSSEVDFSICPQILPDRCVGCGACEVICPADAIKVSCVLTAAHDNI